jgi:hypothetical protein
VLTITVGGSEHFDSKKEQFVQLDTTVIRLEHSLASLSKWESMFEKAFLGPNPHTPEETIGYIKCMCLDDDVPDSVFDHLSDRDLLRIQAYIEAPMTATTFNLPPGPPKSREVITSELIYYWMTIFSIPFECEHWHLNRLFTLIKVCNIKTSKPKKMAPHERASWQRDLNEQRRARLHSRG